MKNLKIILIITLGLTFGCKAQSQEERFKTYKSLIIGTWVSEEDSSNKIEFSSDNKLKIYIDNTLEDTTEYEVTLTCSTSSNNAYDVFLKIQIDTTSFNCDIINNIITDSLGKTTLSITNERGQLEKYLKQ
ncbi:hypothetical protein BTO04_04170 [Polaribacter sp. SA4-10]|uniref:hypothetical protein n=1 Tax=Polaribacter sp. SA4-10 TaxID=754397 RepID=UPI000B3D431D|nr:hypothetical protein [Polaribacter sp. SA4-10]ARV05943.1 hypothetical protein BTO04_04170 [Polaribacter sp. SA4-10]